MGVRINFNQAAARRKLLRHWDESVLHPLSEQILTDCNLYCKEDTGALIASSKLHSRPREGTLVWSTPYAKRQFWEIRSASHDVNAQAVWRWCYAAKAAHMGDWDALAKRLWKGG